VLHARNKLLHPWYTGLYSLVALDRDSLIIVWMGWGVGSEGLEIAMIVLFCLDPLDSSRPDSLYTGEASQLGTPFALIDHDAVVQGRFDLAVRGVPSQKVLICGVYRGWMMTAEQYAGLYQSLLARGIRLINDPASYRHCHHMPESYAAIAGETPRTVWLPTSGEIDIDRIMDLLRPFGDSPLVLKDYVKSGGEGTEPVLLDGRGKAERRWNWATARSRGCPRRPTSKVSTRDCCLYNEQLRCRPPRLRWAGPRKDG
jgi:hypothetical protein